MVNGGDGQVPVTAAAIAALVGGELIGDGAGELLGVAALDRATPRHLSILSHARYVPWFRSSLAGLVLMGEEFRDVPGTPSARLLVPKPMEAMLAVLPHFHRAVSRPAGVHPTAIVAADVALGADVAIEAYAVVGAGASLGDRVWVGAHAVVGDGCQIGPDSRLFPHATCYPFTELGERVMLHAGSQVGREGFGWVPRDGRVQRTPHVGRCVLGDDVEIGANSCVDRGSIDDTVIGAGTKIDSLV